MTDDTKKQPTEAELKAMADAYLETSWAPKMYMYVRVVKGMGRTPEPENQEKMPQVNKKGEKIISVPDLVARAQANADLWEPMLTKMADIAGGIRLYADTSLTTIDVLRDDKLNFDSMNDKKKQSFKREFNNALEQLKKIATSHKNKATNMRMEILEYSNKIVKDHDTSKDIQFKYAEWLKDHKQQVVDWEKENGVKHDETGDALMQKFKEMVNDYHTKWAGLASGAGGATMAMVIFPPFGTIFMFFAMTALAIAAEEMHKLMNKFQDFLNTVSTYHAVKLFFDTLDENFTRMQQVCAAAVAALGEVAGGWQAIEIRLGHLSADVNQIDPLKVTNPEDWEEPISRIAIRNAETVYKDLITKCEEFTRYMYVKDIQEVKAFANTGVRA